MLEQTTKRDAGKNRVGAAFHRDRSRLYLALVLLLMALTVLLVKDRDFWFGGAETQAADETTPEWIPNRVVQPTAVPAAQPKPRVVAVKTSTKSAVAAPAPAVAITRNVLPPLEIEVVAGNTHGTFHLGNKPVNVELPPASAATVAQGPATVATERVQMSLDPAQDQEKVQARPKAIEASYPLLGRQMKVQGSVLLQALIGADGVIRDLRVLGGPAILATAAREAARQWQFKPYLQNGKPVETQATITVNFTIKVLDNGARDQMNTVVALSRGGE